MCSSILIWLFQACHNDNTAIQDSEQQEKCLNALALALFRIMLVLIPILFLLCQASYNYNKLFQDFGQP